MVSKIAIGVAFADRLGNADEQPPGPGVDGERRRDEACHAGGARACGEPVDQRAADASVLPCVGRHVGDLGLRGIRRVAHVAHHPDDAAAFRFERDQCLVPDVVDARQVLELLAAGVSDVRPESPEGRQRAQVLQAALQLAGVLRLDRPDHDAGPVAQPHRLSVDGWGRGVVVPEAERAEAPPREDEIRCLARHAAPAELDPVGGQCARAG